MLHYSKHTLSNIKKESRFISRNAGMIASRILFLFCLFLLFFSLKPTSVYLFAGFAAFPSILSVLLERKEKYKKTPLLESCAKKYHFTYHHYIAEKYTGNLIIFALVLWQVVLMNRNLDYFILEKAPVICMFLYIAARIIFTEITKRKIDKYYGEMECLE